MAQLNSVTVGGIANSEISTALDFDRAIAGVAAGGFLPPSYYSSNIVEQQIGFLSPIEFSFQGSLHRASPYSSGLLGDFVPSIVESLPLNLGYIRTAAFSIAEACYQLSLDLDIPLSKDELKMIIIGEVVQFLEEELNRIELYEEQDNVVLLPSISKRFTVVNNILNAEIGNFNQYISSNVIPTQIQSTKGKTEGALDTNRPAANDERF